MAEPFDWSKYPEAPAFDWSKYPEAPGLPETVARGGAQGLSGGYSEEMEGAGGALVNAIRRTFKNGGQGEAAPGGFGEQFLQDYRQIRDAERGKNEMAKRAHPGPYLASALGGGALGTAAAGLAAPGLLGASTLKAALGSGALLGGASGLGFSDADLTKGDVGGAARDTAIGAGIGAAGGGLGYGATQAVKGAANWLPGFGARQAVKTAGVTPNPGQSAEDTGNALLESGVVAPGVSRASIPKRLADVQKQLMPTTTQEQLSTSISGLPANSSLSYGTSAGNPLGGLSSSIPESQGGSGAGLLAALGHPIAAGAQLAKQQLASRGGSTLAWGSKAVGDRLRQMVMENPQALGNAGKILSRSLTEGEPVYSANAFVLGQTDPEFQEVMRKLAEMGTDAAHDQAREHMQ